MRTYLEDLTNEALAERLAQIEKLGKTTAARLAAGERGDPQTLAVVRGRHHVIYQLEATLNFQRTAWKNTREEMRRRGVA